MNIDEEFEFGHLVLHERKCRTCGKVKDLIDGFYLIRKSRGDIPSSYSYECKECTKTRVKTKRRNNKEDIYPDW
jgi:DNA-directed RNA polymerase subunit M/transcription elongation factor TFIIS|tara:strand:+ start:458 stop:679 length:222 start_codon:yes stop_codon:yes gene_type:complete